MAKGMLPDVAGDVKDKVSQKHMLIKLPGDYVKRAVFSKKSLLYLAYFLGLEYVQLPGYIEGPIKVTSLPKDMLNSTVYMYKINSYKTFTAIIAGSGYQKWDGKTND